MGQQVKHETAVPRGLLPNLLESSILDMECHGHWFMMDFLLPSVETDLIVPDTRQQVKGEIAVPRHRLRGVLVSSILDMKSPGYCSHGFSYSARLVEASQISSNEVTRKSWWLLASTFLCIPAFAVPTEDYHTRVRMYNPDVMVTALVRRQPPPAQQLLRFSSDMLLNISDSVQEIDIPSMERNLLMKEAVEMLETREA